MSEGKFSRRDFLKLFGGIGALALADEVFLGGAVREVFLKSIINQEYRQKVIDKVKNGEAVDEFVQQVGDRTNSAEPTVLGSEVEYREDWMDKFAEFSVFELENEQHKGKTVFLAEIPKIDLQVAKHEKRGGIVFYEEPEFLKSGSVILPGMQITSDGSSNSYFPATFTEVVDNEGEIKTFLDVRTGRATGRDGALVLSKDGKSKIIPSGDENNYMIGDGNKGGEIVFRTVIPFAVDLDLSKGDNQVLSSLSEQFQKINSNSSVLGSDEITESLRYETFYLQADDKLLLLGVFKTDKSNDWEFDKRLSISQAVDLSLQIAKQNNYSKLTLVPTDPDYNDGVYLVGGDNWQNKSITHKGEDNLQQQPFYLTV